MNSDTSSALWNPMPRSKLLPSLSESGSNMPLIPPLFEAPLGYRFLRDQELIEAGDILCSDFGEQLFIISEKHIEVGNAYDDSCMPIIRKL